MVFRILALFFISFAISFSSGLAAGSAESLFGEIFFEPNLGQTSREIHFVARTKGA